MVCLGFLFSFMVFCCLLSLLFGVIYTCSCYLFSLFVDFRYVLFVLIPFVCCWLSLHVGCRCFFGVLAWLLLGFGVRSLLVFVAFCVSWFAVVLFAFVVWWSSLFAGCLVFRVLLMVLFCCWCSLFVGWS